jgi:YVTN family beta-propeller protein
VLDEELGVEPGPELQRLERQILNHDPELGEPAPAPPPLMRQPRYQSAAAVAVALAAATSFAVVALSRGGTTASTRPNVTNPREAVSTIDPRTNRVVSTTSVGRYPARMAYDRNAVWVLNSQDETISRIDPRTRLVVHTFAPGSPPSDLKLFAGALWVATPLANRVLRLDESTDEVSARIAAPHPLFVGSGDGRVWVFGRNLLTIDPVKDRPLVVFDPHLPRFRAYADANPGSVVVLDGRVFFDNAGAGITRVDPATGSLRRSRLHQWGDSSRMIALNGSLWLTSSQADDLMRVDPDGLELTMNVTVGSRPVGVAFGAGSLWVANSGDGTVMRIDPASGRILTTIRVGGTPYDLSFSHGRAWVTIL